MGSENVSELPVFHEKETLQRVFTRMGETANVFGFHKRQGAHAEAHAPVT
jgi:hypothetical protein